MTTISPISDVTKKSAGEMAHDYLMNFKKDWIFNKPIEKIIIAGSFFWAVFSIVKFVWSLISG